MSTQQFYSFILLYLYFDTIRSVTLPCGDVPCHFGRSAHCLQAQLQYERHNERHDRCHDIRHDERYDEYYI